VALTGARTVYRPLKIEVDMERTATLHAWEKMPRERLTDKLERRIITADRMMITHVYLKKGCIVPRHHHDNEQITYILDGALRFTLGENGEKVVDVHSGEVLCIPSNLPHSAEALEDTVDVDIFDPPRRDWLDGTDLYLRRG
jgi:quercetin dioxygenase-like cupin family protein